MPMQVGVTIFITDRSIAPDRLAREVEDRGLDCLCVPEHTHIPVSRKTPYPMGDGSLPDEYRRTFDPFVALTAAAVATTRLQVGTAVCLVAQHDPILLAKQVASLDLLSGGRFFFGVGHGWNVDEMESHGVDPSRRRAVVREKMLAMERLWADEVAEFHGDHVELAASWQWPKPRQRPRPPVLVGGGATPRQFADIAEWADGWMPLGGHGVRAAIPQLRAAFEEAGRDPDSASITVTAPVPDPERLAYYESLGVERVCLFLPSEGPDVVLPVLDQYAKVAAAVRPTVL